MTGAAEPESVCGRYRTLGFTRWPPTIFAPVWLVSGLFGDPFYLVPGVAFALLALAAWLVPATVITERAARRPILRRAYPWSQVEGADVGTGWKAGLVQLHLRDGDLVALAGVPADAIPGIRRLISASRHPSAGQGNAS